MAKDAKGHGSDAKGASDGFRPGVQPMTAEQAQSLLGRSPEVHAALTGSHQSGVQQVGQRPLTESPASQNLRLTGDNDANLYRQSFQPVVANLTKKMDKGMYDPEKAKVLWGHHADRAAQSAAKQSGDSRPWHQQFPPAVRREAAQHWEASERSAIKNGEYK